MKESVEGLHIALEMERRAYLLYARGQKIAPDPAVRALLTRLAEEEASHYAYFTSLQYAHQAQNEQDGQSDTDTGNSILEASLAAEALFPGGLMQAAMSGGLDSPEALLTMAIQGEVDSIAFYETLRDRFDESTHKDLTRIIGEEKHHLAELQDWQ
jgi:rubrerythrin